MFKHKPRISRKHCSAVFQAHLVVYALYGVGLATAQSVTGRVVNGLSGVPIPRALVRLNQRARLTDTLGHFEFQQVTDLNPSLVASKPGFYTSLDTSESGSSPVAADPSGAPTVLQLYPEAIIVGTVSTRSGEPLAHIRLSLTRLTYGDSGPRFQTSGATATDTHGEFRFATQPGAYRLNLTYSPAGRERSDAVLPAVFPEQNSSSAFATFQVGSGEVRHVDLHPKTGIAFPLRLRIDGSSGERSLQIMVRTTAGSEFTVPAREDHADAQVRSIDLELPAGSYHLHALTSGQQTEEAEATINVTGKDEESGILHLQPIASLPVLVQLDVSHTQANTVLTLGTTSSTPDLAEFAPSLRRVDGDESSAPGVRIDARPDRTLAVTAPAGVYRLTLHNVGQWYVKSAFYGTTDLLTHNLVVSPGAGSEAIRLLVSSDTGKLAGIAHTDGAPAQAWVYLVANGPSAAPVITMHTQRDGSFVQSYMPPGSYTVLALPRRVSVDLTSPEIRASLGGRASTVQVVGGAEATVDLDVAPDQTARQGQQP